MTNTNQLLAIVEQRGYRAGDAYRPWIVTYHAACGHKVESHHNWAESEETVMTRVAESTGHRCLHCRYTHWKRTGERDGFDAVVERI